MEDPIQVLALAPLNLIARGSHSRFALTALGIRYGIEVVGLSRRGLERLVVEIPGMVKLRAVGITIRLEVPPLPTIALPVESNCTNIFEPGLRSSASTAKRGLVVHCRAFGR